jgi:hypothetical protein
MSLETKLKVSSNTSNEEILDRIEKLEQQINTLTHNDVYRTIEKKHIALITSPIKKTNLIMKNVNFQYATKLWDYLQQHIDDDVKQDIFDINKAPLDVFHFVGHEFIIFLLMQELKDVNELDDWKRFESLAEYYLIQILGNSRGSFDFVKDYIEFYENCNKEKNLSAVELYKKGAEFLK